MQQNFGGILSLNLEANLNTIARIFLQTIEIIINKYIFDLYRIKNSFQINIINNSPF